MMTVLTSKLPGELLVCQTCGQKPGSITFLAEECKSNCPFRLQKETPMLTPERAREIIKKQSQFPYWGEYTRFMTPSESAFTQDLFRKSNDGNISIARIVERISRLDTQQKGR